MTLRDTTGNRGPNEERICEATDPVFWATFLTQLDEAHSHLGDIVIDMAQKREIDEIDLAVRLGHVYGHLNRAWNCRRLQSEDEEKWYDPKSSGFPDDLIRSFVI